MSTDPLEKKGIALVVLSKSGLQLALRVQNELKSDAHIYGSQRVLKRQSAVLDEDGTASFERVGPLLEGLWLHYEQIVLFFALGAAVRLIAPLLRGKQSDPDVVVIDDSGHFAISVVAGPWGEASRLTSRCAHILDAQAVITTTSEVQGTLALDRLARANGWYIEPESALTSVAASLANGERIAVLQEPQLVHWKREEEPWMENFVSVSTVDEVIPAACTALLIFSDRLFAALPPAIPTIICRPASLVLGIGCSQDVPSCDVLDTWVTETLKRQHIALKSVVTLATTERKADAAGLIQLAQHRRWTYDVHSIEQLQAVSTSVGQVETVQPPARTPSFCEAAAFLSSQGGELLLSRQQSTGMTLAVARKPCVPVPLTEIG